MNFRQLVVTFAILNLIAVASARSEAFDIPEREDCDTMAQKTGQISERYPTREHYLGCLVAESVPTLLLEAQTSLSTANQSSSVSVDAATELIANQLRIAEANAHVGIYIAKYVKTLLSRDSKDYGSNRDEYFENADTFAQMGEVINQIVTVKYRQFDLISNVRKLTRLEDRLSRLETCNSRMEALKLEPNTSGAVERLFLDPDQYQNQVRGCAEVNVNFFEQLSLARSSARLARACEPGPYYSATVCAMQIARQIETDLMKNEKARQKDDVSGAQFFTAGSSFKVSSLIGAWTGTAGGIDIEIAFWQEQRSTFGPNVAQAVFAGFARSETNGCEVYLDTRHAQGDWLSNLVSYGLLNEGEMNDLVGGRRAILFNKRDATPQERKDCPFLMEGTVIGRAMSPDRLKILYVPKAGPVTVELRRTAASAKLIAGVRRGRPENKSAYLSASAPTREELERISDPVSETTLPLSCGTLVSEIRSIATERKIGKLKGATEGNGNYVLSINTWGASGDGIVLERTLPRNERLAKPQTYALLDYERQQVETMDQGCEDVRELHAFLLAEEEGGFSQSEYRVTARRPGKR